MRLKRYVALACAVMLGLTGCGGNAAVSSESGAESVSSESSAEEVSSAESESSGTEAAEDILAAHTSFLGETDMELADMWPSCDDRALAAAMRKAENGESITVACIGGSITQGTIAPGTMDKEVAEKKPYADIFCDWWEERFPDTEVNFINAGIGGTDSYYGVHRLEADVMCHEPDVVLVEFAVNDGGDAFFKKSYDNLLYNLLHAEKAPAVMLLFMAQSSGISAQANQVLIGYRYGVPMVSYANVMEDMLETGRYKEKELSGDVVHPSAVGHAITGEILWSYLNNVYAVRNELEEPEQNTAEPLTMAVYGNAKVQDGENTVPEEMGDFKETTVWGMLKGWKCEGGENGIVFTATFSRLGLLYYATTDGKSGQYDVLIDGEVVRSVNADFSGGWGNAVKTVEVYSSDEAAEHKIEIRKSDNSTGEDFHLLGLLTSEVR